MLTSPWCRAVLESLQFVERPVSNPTMLQSQSAKSDILQSRNSTVRARHDRQQLLRRGFKSWHREIFRNWIFYFKKYCCPTAAVGQSSGRDFVEIRLRNIIHDWKARVQFISRRSEPNLESTLDISAVSTTSYNSRSSHTATNHASLSTSSYAGIVIQTTYSSNSMISWNFDGVQIAQCLEEKVISNIFSQTDEI